MTTLPRESKFRHIFNEIATADQSFTDIRPDCFGESQHIAVNGTYWATPITAGGGGSFMVHPLSEVGRIPRDHKLFKMHTARILELAFGNFDDRIIASTSDDCSVRVSRVPDDLSRDVLEADAVLTGHSKKATCLAWHPTVDNLLASSGNDKNVILWDVEEQVDAVQVPDHGDLVYSLQWNDNGQYLASSCQDRTIRVMDPRQEESVVMSVLGHENKKHSKIFWLDDRNMVGSSGFTKDSYRELLFYDIRKMADPFHRKKLDRQNSKFLPVFVQENDLLYLIGKGDTGMRIYEITDQEGFCHPITELKALDPQKGVAVMPRRHLDTAKCEIFRTYRLKSSAIEPVSVLVPRRNSAMVFQEDLYPDCYAGVPSLSIDDYFDEKNEDAKTVSMDKTGRSTNTNRGYRRRGRGAAAEEAKAPSPSPSPAPKKRAVRNRKTGRTTTTPTRVESPKAQTPPASSGGDKKVAELEAKLSKLEKTIKAKDEEIAEEKKSLEKAEKKLKDAKSELKSLNDELKEKDKQIKKLKDDLKAGGGGGDAQAELTEEIETLKRKLKIQRKKRRGVEKDLENSEKIINKQAKSIKALNHKLIELEPN